MKIVTGTTKRNILSLSTHSSSRAPLSDEDSSLCASQLCPWSFLEVLLLSVCGSVGCDEESTSMGESLEAVFVLLDEWGALGEDYERTNYV